MRKIVFTSLLAFVSLFAKDIAITPSMQTLYVNENQLTLLNFPFEPKMENVQILGVKNGFSGSAKGKSLYFTTTEFPIELIVFNDNVPVYLKIEQTKEKSERVYNFFYKNKGVSDVHELSELDQTIVDIFHNIDRFGNLQLESFYKKDANKEINLKKLSKLKIKHIETLENERFTIEKYELTNNYSQLVDLRTISELYSLENLLSYTYSNFYLASNKSTIGYFVFDKTKEL